jgi:hypothetical protein
MAQHISMFHNETNNGAFTAKAKSKQDYYFIGRGQALKPDQEVLIEKGSWTSFDTAFLKRILSSQEALLIASGTLDPAKLLVWRPTIRTRC